MKRPIILSGLAGLTRRRSWGMMLYALVLGGLLIIPRSGNCMHSVRINSRVDSTAKPALSTALSADSFITLGGGLPGFADRVRRHESVKVAFLGGSITHMNGWRDKVTGFLIKAYPQVKFDFLDAGIPSLGSVPHAFRFGQDVLEKMTPDLLFIEAAVNDAVNGTPVMEQKRALEGIIRQAHRSSPDMEIVLMAFADEQKNDAYAKGDIPVSVKIHRDIAAYYNLPFINLAKEVYSRIQHGEFTWAGSFKSLHPAPFGQELYFNAIKTLLVGEINKANQYNAIKPSKRKWPLPMQKLTYDQGHYVAVEKAADLHGFKVVPDWTPKDNVNTRPGFVHVPVLEGTAAGSSFKLTFTGTAVGIAVLSGPDAGCIQYQIDGGPLKKMDLYTQWSGSLYLPWYLLLGDGLKTGSIKTKHTLKVVIATGGVQTVLDGPVKLPETATTPKTAVRIVHFLVNGPSKVE